MGDYPDYTAIDNKVQFYLNANTTMHPDKWKTPINWEGFVAGVRVEFTQIQKKAASVEDFDFSLFPQSLDKAKVYIVQAIDKKLRTMD